MERKNMLTVVIVLLAVVVVVDVAFMFMGATPVIPPPGDGEGTGDGIQPSGGGLGILLDNLQKTLNGASETLEGIENKLNE